MSLEQYTRKAVDKAGYQGTPLFRIPYKTLCQAAGLEKDEGKYPIITTINPRVRGVIKRIDTKDLAESLIQEKKLFKKVQALPLR